MRLLLIRRVAGAVVTVSATLSEDTLRRYAADRRASADHFPWLARVSPALCLSATVEGAYEQRAETWALRRGEESGAHLRVRFLRSGLVRHFEGGRGAERMVRGEFADGEVQYFEGEQDAERVVRREFADGTVQYFEGEEGAERMVRAVLPSGQEQHYEGAKGEERCLRAVWPEGEEQHFEGAKGEERRVTARQRRAEQRRAHGCVPD